MIVSASYRTDIPAFYGRWFLNRLAAGYACVANPYGGRPARVDLTPAAVDGFVFWTRNLAPFGESLDAVDRLGLPFVVQYSLTGLPRALERSVTAPDAAIAAMGAVRRHRGVRAVVWRYDPIVITTLTPPDWHRATFARLAAALKGITDEVVVSFLQPYRKTMRNLDAAARARGFAWRDPEADEKRALLADLAATAAEHGMVLTLCTQPDLTGVPGTAPARCVDARRLADVAGRPLEARTRGNRPGCLCAESRDIGAYDSCPHGCAYCYAVADRDRAAARHRAHDPDGAFLFSPGAGATLG
ncbi:DUF1848 domain-containing protein [Azospirillum halopraeferens]|uniref:DUF1848 domain-containing protein n=1 Tax=Azospirillum halopraeferens TaxID=34010 RepID=UPI0003FFDACD|nr:DUF1848 domain-containing protein [Azospirillum halopraeferens]